jgi:hypothetical protein
MATADDANAYDMALGLLVSSEWAHPASISLSVPMALEGSRLSMSASIMSME